jgi:hypothetical protein
MNRLRMFIYLCSGCDRILSVAGIRRIAVYILTNDTRPVGYVHWADMPFHPPVSAPFSDNIHGPSES